MKEKGGRLGETSPGEERSSETGKMVRYRTWKRRTCEATLISLVDEPKKSSTGTRRTETCVAPRHVDASRDFSFIFSERAAWGEGGEGGEGTLPDFLTYSLLPVQ